MHYNIFQLFWLSTVVSYSYNHLFIRKRAAATMISCTDFLQIAANSSLLPNPDQAVTASAETALYVLTTLFPITKKCPYYPSGTHHLQCLFVPTACLHTSHHLQPGNHSLERGWEGLPAAWPALPCPCPPLPLMKASTIIRRWIFPVAVFGSLSVTKTCSGTCTHSRRTHGRAIFTQY